MTHEQREIHRKKRILECAERVGNINKTCRYFWGCTIDLLPVEGKVSRAR
jgi:hypothetical protein